MEKIIRELQPKEYAAICAEKLRDGAFLTTSVGDKVNSMWVNWGSIGYTWRRYCCTVWVRPSRYTTELLRQNPSFTVSIPLRNEHKEALRVCGKLSGRDEDKLKVAGIETRSPKTGTTPVIAGTGFIHLECRLVMIQDPDLDTMDPELKAFFYESEPNNAHIAYIGEITSAYEV